MPKTGFAFFSHGNDELDLPPILCKVCARPLMEKPFLITVYFADEEINFEHVECAQKEIDDERIR